ncbi:MAG: transglycosylase SLT domain-containing protein [Candidatus Dadabacteria bacterium]|nr:transglycosylase SLT domain-containing protein [Candidatus Dadabacteria bacterium]
MDPKKAALSVFLLALLLLAAAAEGARANHADCGKVLQSTEKTLEARFLKVHCHARERQHAEVHGALAEIKDKLIFIEDYLLYYEAEAALGLGQKERAEVLFLKILKHHPDSAIGHDARERLAEIHLENDRHAEAEKTYSHLAERTDSRWKKAVYLKNLGEIKERQGDFPAASEIFERIWAEHPEVSFSDYAFELHKKNGKVFAPSPQQFEKRGDVMFEAGNWEGALEAFSAAPRTNAVRTKTGICLYRLSRFPEALKVFSGIDSPKAFYWRGVTLMSMEKEEEAIGVFERLHRLNPKSSWTSKSLLKAARLRHLRKEPEEAHRLYRLVIEKYPGREEARESAWNIGWMHYSKKEYAKAAEAFSDRAWARGRDRERFLYWYARASERAGDKPGALFALGELAKSPKITYYSALAKMRLGENLLHTPPPAAAWSGNPFGKNPALEKFLFFVKAGVYDLALREAELLRPHAKTRVQRLYLASLYLQARDYKTSITLANGVRSPEALRLSFPKGFEERVKAFSRKYTLDEFLVYSVIREESHFDKEAVSVSDARGLMQLLPSTALETAPKAGLSNFQASQLFSPDINLELGCYYLSWLLEIFEGNFAISLAGYNGGPTSAKTWYEKNGALDIDEFIEEIPFEQSRNYVKKIIRSYAAYEAVYGREKDRFSRQSFEKFLKIMSP